MSNAVTFHATIPLLQSAVTFAGDGGGRLRLEFDDSQTAQVVELLNCRGELLRVTVERV